MKNIAIILSLILASTLAAHAQQQSTSQLRRASQGTPTSGNVSAAARSAQPSGRDDSDLQWMRTIYRSLSLQDDANAPLAFPEEAADGGDNLFRTVMKLVASGKVPAYEFVDGRESFTPNRRVDPAESMRRFDIPFREAKGSTLKAPVYEVESADIPSDDVKSYYLIERWEFNRHTNRMETRMEAICPVLHRTADIGLEPLRYPAFWVRMDDLRPYLAATLIATSDDNNLATHTLADYFNLRLYKGEIYKTGDRRNRPLAQIFQTPESLQHARDSIEQRLQAFEKGLWVPSLEEVNSDSTATERNGAKKSVTPTKRPKTPSVTKRKPAKETKVRRQSTGRSNVTRSVRNRKP